MDRDYHRRAARRGWQGRKIIPLDEARRRKLYAMFDKPFPEAASPIVRRRTEPRTLAEYSAGWGQRGAIHRRRNSPLFVLLSLTAFLTFAFALLMLRLADGSDVVRFANTGVRMVESGSGDTLSARFGLCHRGGGVNCVVDGDTFWFDGEKYRFAGIDTPETHPARCAEEQRLGDAATARLRSLLNAGPFSLESGWGDPDTDRYGRKLRDVTRGGVSLGDVLIAEGLARPYAGGRRSWC